MKFIGYDGGSKVLADAPTGGSLLSVDTYTAARALTAGQLTGQTLVHVRGRSAANDGAGGIFAVVSGAGTDDGGVVLSVASNTMRLVRQYEGIASAAWWGVLPTSNDVGPALQAAQDWADGFSQKRGIFIPEGIYWIRTPVTLKVPTEGVRPEGSSDGNHGTVFQWVSPATWPSTVNGRLCDLFEPVFQTEFNNATTLRNISLYGDYGGNGSNKDTYLDGAMFPSLKFFKIPTNGMTGIEIARGVEIINCKCQGFLIGMQNRDASHTRIDNCTLDGNYVGMWYWANRGDHQISDTGLTSHIAGSCAGGEGWTVQMDGNHLGFGSYGLLQIGTPRQDPLRDNRSQWRHWYNNSYTVKKASRFNVGTLSGAYGEYQLGDTVGLFNQDTPSQNGIWIVNSGAWTRDASFTPVKDALVIVRFSANVGIRETVWQVATTNPVIGQPITFVEHPVGGVWECLFRNSRFEACGQGAIRGFSNSATGNCELEFTGSGFDTQIASQIFNLSPAMIAAMGEQMQQYLFHFGVIQSTFLFREDNFTNSGLSPQAGAVRAGNYIHQLNLPANVDLDLRGLGKITFGQLTNQRSEGALLTKVRQSGDNAFSLNPYQDMPPTYNPGKLQPGGLYDLLNPAAWNAGDTTILSLVDAASVDPYPLDMAISLPPNAKAIYFDKNTNPWAWGWRQTATFPVMGQRFGHCWAWVKGRVSLKIRPRNGSGQITEYRGDTRSEISGWQPLQLGNMDFTGATHIEFRIDSENSSSFWIAGAVFSWDDYAPYSETTRPATRDGFQLLNGNFATTIDTTTLTADRTATFQNKSGTVAFLDDIGSGSGVTDGDKGDIVVSSSGTVWTVDNGVIDNDNIAANAGIEWSKISKTGASAGDIADLAEFIRDTIGATLVQGANITIAVDDPTNTITISSPGGGGGTVLDQEYETPGTQSFQWPAGYRHLEYTIIGSGGGSGSGRRSLAGTTRCGGGSGGSGGITRGVLSLDDIAELLGTTNNQVWLDIVIPAGGTGGAAITTDDTNGANGTNGGAALLRVKVGSGGTPVLIGQAAGGTAGNGGTGTNGTAGSGGAIAEIAGIGGTIANTSGGAGVNAATANLAPGVGGSGGGITSTNSASVGGNGGIGARALRESTVAAPATNAVVHGLRGIPGNGGGGGNSNGTRDGGNGYRGSSGGGGAASLNGTASGRGGNGGDGYAWLRFIP